MFILPIGSSSIDTAKIIDVDNQPGLFVTHHILYKLSINSISILQSNKVNNNHLLNC
jgi:hypothetical protein